MISWWEALLLGILQGLSEFLPISSSGHLQIGAALFDWQSQHNLLFVIAWHVATGLSIVGVYRKKIGALLLGLHTFRGRKEVSLLLLSAVPAGLVGLFLKDWVSEIYASGILIVGIALLFNGLLLLLPKLLHPSLFSQTKARAPTTHLGIGRVLFMGTAQAIAILPGISRSGSTISTALLGGVEPQKAAEFSFLMALFPIFGSAVLELLHLIHQPPDPSSSLSQHWVALVVGFVAAFAVGWWACRRVIQWVSKGQLHYFSFYCIGLGIVCIMYSY